MLAEDLPLSAGQGYFNFLPILLNFSKVEEAVLNINPDPTILSEFLEGLIHIHLWSPTIFPIVFGVSLGIWRAPYEGGQSILILSLRKVGWA